MKTHIQVLITGLTALTGRDSQEKPAGARITLVLI